MMVDRMPQLRLGRPLWLDRGSERDAIAFPSAAGAIATDVVIVGGGITGAAIAWRFADAGIRVVLLEAERIGHGSTAASTALLMQEPDEDFSATARRYGAAYATRIWRLGAAATRDLVRTLRKLEIDCDLSRSDSVYFTLTAARARHLHAEYGRRRSAGIRGRWIDADRARHAFGFDAAGAIRTDGNAQVDPYKACLGFMRTAVENGGVVFERSPVERIDPVRHGVIVRTRHATVRAERVVIATGYATPYFKPLHARFRMVNTYVVCTRPLTARERRQLGLGRVMLWDTDRPYHYARWTPDHRLLLGGGDRPLVSGAARPAALRHGALKVAGYFADLFPMLADVANDYMWDGLFAMTPDGLPYIGPHRRYPWHLFALGYGGNGMTLGFLASRLLLEAHLGRAAPDLDLFSFTR